MVSDLRSRSILCVQRERHSSDQLCEMLSQHECVIASSAYEALRGTRPFDAYLLDSQLPDWAGPALCREIRKRDPNSPIVFCTDATGRQDRLKALRAGASAYLCKPIDREVLTTKLDALFRCSDVESLHAKSDAERAVDEVIMLQRAATPRRMDADRYDDDTERTLERAARGRAYQAFIESGGIRVNFDCWWPQVFGSARTHHGLG